MFTINSCTRTIPAIHKTIGFITNIGTLVNKKLIERLALIPAFFLFICVLIKNAWLSDDSFITFRLARNFADGYGMRWNLAERVQVFTHPTWMFLMTLFIKIFNNFDAYYILIALSIVFSILAVGVFFLFVGKGHPWTLIAVLLFSFSKAFVDYSTSGLENPLSHLVLTIFCLILIRYPHKKTLLYFIGSLAILTRHDNALFILPAVLYSFITGFSIKSVKGILIGFSPFIFWTLFSIFYFGFPLPNTYYAKLNIDIPQVEVTKSGLLYMADSLSRDPITLVVIFTGIFLGVLSKKKYSTISIGISLYLFYIVRIGGDFMSGRFLTVPFILAMFVICDFALEKIYFTEKVVLLGTFAMIVLLGGPRLDTDINKLTDLVIHPVQPEKEYYYINTGFLNNLKDFSYKAHPWYLTGLSFQRDGVLLYETACIGLVGVSSPRDTYILDRIALSDPFLSHLPYKSNLYTRAGHLSRTYGADYLESVKTDTNVLENACLHKYYDKIRLVTRGNLLDKNRIKEIIRLNVGKYDYLLKADCKV